MTGARYQMQLQQAAVAPWGAAAKQFYSGVYGHDSLGATVGEILVRNRAASTLRTYATGYRKFLQYCAEQQLEPYSATPADVVRYVAWVGLQGTVAAATMQPYLTAIDSVRKDVGLDSIAAHPSVKAIVNGLRGVQLDTRPAPVRVPLPAPVAWSCLESVLQLGMSPDVGQALPLIRAQLATFVGLQFGVRASSLVAIQQRDVVVDPPTTSDARITISLRFEKGRNRNQRGMRHRVVSAPVRAAVPLHVAVSLWRALRLRAGASTSPTGHFWALPGEAPQHWTAANTVTDWVQTATRAVGYTLPAGAQYSSHSLRGGMASSANSVGVPLAQIRSLGGWAADSAVVHDYIDPSVRPTPQARAIFDWLRPQQ